MEATRCVTAPTPCCTVTVTAVEVTARACDLVGVHHSCPKAARFCSCQSPPRELDVGSPGCREGQLLCSSFALLIPHVTWKGVRWPGTVRPGCTLGFRDACGSLSLSSRACWDLLPAALLMRFSNIKKNLRTVKQTFSYLPPRFCIPQLTLGVCVCQAALFER